MRPGSPSPKQAVPGAMPRDYRVGLDENESFGPIIPDPPNDNPEQPIESIQLGGAAVSVCKPQVVAEERPTPLPDSAVSLAMPEHTLAKPTNTSAYSALTLCVSAAV